MLTHCVAGNVQANVQMTASSSSYTACQALCQATSGCNGWNFAVNPSTAHVMMNNAYDKHNLNACLSISDPIITLSDVTYRLL